jgi:hypothetical protein
MTATDLHAGEPNHLDDARPQLREAGALLGHGKGMHDKLATPATSWPRAFRSAEP